jgi:hypothetical protein
MNHPEELLAGYVDGSLSDQDREAVEAHLSTCATCREEVQLARSATGALRALPHETAPQGFTEKMLEAAKENGAGPTSDVKWAKGYRILGLAVAAAIVALLVVWLPHLGRSTSENASAPQVSTGNEQGAVGSPTTGVPPLQIVRINFDPIKAAALIKGKTADSVNSGPQAPLPTGIYGGDTTAFSTASPESAQAALGCLNQAFTGFGGEPTRLILAKYQGQPAYIGIYTERPGAGLPPNALSVRVASVKDCTILSYSTVKL